MESSVIVTVGGSSSSAGHSYFNGFTIRVYSLIPQELVNIDDMLRNTLQSMGVPGSIIFFDTSGVYTIIQKNKLLIIS